MNLIFDFDHLCFDIFFSHFQPMEVYVDDEAKLTLHGLQQHFFKLKDAGKNRKLFELLDVLEFNQVVIFVKSVQRCMALAQLLIEQNFPAIAIHRGMAQEERLSRYQQFKDFQKVRLFVSFWCARTLTLICMRGDTFISLFFFGVRFCQKNSNFFGGEN